MLRLTF